MTALGFILFCASLLIPQSKNSVPPPPLYPVPSESQLAWHEMEQNAFVHFTMNTFTGREWGEGDESPALFNPTAFDAGQWARVFHEAGFKGVILTCKHHDGFCLWPSAYNEHSVKNSPYKNGRGDIVREVAEACKRYGLKFGVYVSPWDRNHAEYGRAAYIDYYRNQLRELFTNYGPVFEMWFDGANGGSGYYGGARATRRVPIQTYYEWPATLELVQSWNPNIIFFSDGGPGVRWCGNERGLAGETNWCTFSNDTIYAGKAGIEEVLNRGMEDGNKWIPAEVDVSIRPGWFYHSEEDSLVKSSQQLFELYLSSVGRGSTLLLNVPPDRRGLIHENDIASLKGWKHMLDWEFRTNLALHAQAEASSFRGESYAGPMATDGKKETYWATDDSVKSGHLVIDLGKQRTVKYVVLQEYVRLGQRVRSFTIEAQRNGAWERVAVGTTVGYKRILRFDPVVTGRIRVTIVDAKACPVISNVEVY
ncbi:MAG TPA: alpha-L-fucosidase [Bacteroidota bacterium]